MTRVKRSLIFSGGLSALVIVCGLSQARGNPGPTKRGEAEAKFRELDKDKSGFLERAEFPGDDPLFRRADRDGDEKLSFDEALQLLIETEVEKVFMTFDQDRDGVIRIEEVTDERHRANFMAVDKDADGQLTAEEVLAAIRAQFQGDPPGSQKNDVGGKRPPTWAQILSALDKDGDRLISRGESREGLERGFARFDGDRDGFISEREYESQRLRIVRILERSEALQKLLAEHGAKLQGRLKNGEIDEAETGLAELEAALLELLRARGKREAH